MSSHALRSDGHDCVGPAGLRLLRELNARAGGHWATAVAQTGRVGRGRVGPRAGDGERVRGCWAKDGPWCWVREANTLGELPRGPSGQAS
jgi:hypothetical protein